MLTDTTSILFPLGKTAITPAALDLLTDAMLGNLLARHQSGDWGEMTEGDKTENDLSVLSGDRIFSAYNIGDHDRVWVITEADRSSTTILLPSDY